MIDQIISTLNIKLKAQTEEQKKRDIDKLKSNIGSHKNESIKEAVCRLVYEYYNKYDHIDDSLVLTSESEYIETITEIYTVRSQLVHSTNHRHP